MNTSRVAIISVLALLPSLNAQPVREVAQSLQAKLAALEKALEKLTAGSVAPAFDRH